MNSESQNKISKILGFEIAIGVIIFTLIYNTGLTGLLFAYSAPIISLVFVLIIYINANNYQWQPIGWKALFTLNIILFFQY